MLGKHPEPRRREHYFAALQYIVWFFHASLPELRPSSFHELLRLSQRIRRPDVKKRRIHRENFERDVLSNQSGKDIRFETQRRIARKAVQLDPRTADRPPR